MSADDLQPGHSAGLESFRLISAGHREAWIDLFADDCLFEDPVGVSPLDPEGKGHRKSELGRFWDKSIGRGDMNIVCKIAKPIGNECAFLVDATNNLPEGSLEVEAIVFYRVNDEGKIVSVRAFWEWTDTVDQGLNP
jgi:steroid delta-isomerase